jgi:hypothetical protein
VSAYRSVAPFYYEQQFNRDEGLWRCGAGACGKFYHHSCLRKWQRGLGLTLGSAHDSSLCPRHNFCGRGDACEHRPPAAAPDAAAAAAMDAAAAAAALPAVAPLLLPPPPLIWRCLRCPTAYHPRCRRSDVHVVDFGAKLFSCLRHVLDASAPRVAGPELALLLEGRRRLRLGTTPGESLDDFLARKREARKGGSGGGTSDSRTPRRDTSEDDGGDGGGDGVSPRMPESAAPPGLGLIPKKIPKKEPAVGAASESAAAPAATVAAGATIKGTRIKIKGFDPNAPAQAVNLLRSESAEAKRRRLGYTGLAVGGGVAKRGSAARAGVMAWAAQQMATFSDRGDASSGGDCGSGSGGAGNGGNCGSGVDDNAADLADPSLFPTSLYDPAPPTLTTALAANLTVAAAVDAMATLPYAVVAATAKGEV